MRWRIALKRIVLTISRLLGLFALARWLTRRKLRILAYHSVALCDEDVFRPETFIGRDAFRGRLEHLARAKYPVLRLGRALDLMYQGKLPNRATVITIDDGFASTVTETVPMLESFGFPATLYVTSYYAEKRTPIFRLVVQYLFWKTQARTLDRAAVGLDPGPDVDLSDERSADAAMWELIRYGENALDDAGRMELCRVIARTLDVELDPVIDDRSFSIANADELQALASRGIELGLHTHRHRFPTDGPTAALELEQNRSFLEPLVGRRIRHFCYPGGDWSPAHWPSLATAGVISATTGDTGLNDARTPPLALRRMGDAAHVSQVEFEAELSGFGELARNALRRLRRFVGGAPAGTATEETRPREQRRRPSTEIGDRLEFHLNSGERRARKALTRP